MAIEGLPQGNEEFDLSWPYLVKLYCKHIVSKRRLLFIRLIIELIVTNLP